MACMKLKKLEQLLQDVDGFSSPKIELEQYITPPHIASCMLYNIETKYQDINGKLVGDLGCGCGMLGIGATLLGAPLTIGFEIDGDALEMLRSNVLGAELEGIDCVQADVLNLRDSKWENTFDTIVTNPPFGTKNNSGMDVRFVECAVHLATGTVYSLHKRATRSYIQKKSREWRVKGEVMAELCYNIDACYKFHKRQSRDIEVDLWRFDVSEKGN